MPSPKLTPEQAAKQKEALKKFHEDGKKGLRNTSANAPKESRTINSVRRKISDLTHSAADIVKKAVEGGLVPEMEVWKGTEEEKHQIQQTDRSSKFEIVEVEDGMDVEVLIRYVPVSKNRVEISKWIISQDIALKKAAEESKLRKLEVAFKTKKAVDDGVVPEEDKQQKAKDFGGPRPLFSMDYVEDEEPEEDE